MTGLIESVSQGQLVVNRVSELATAVGQCFLQLLVGHLKTLLAADRILLLRLLPPGLCRAQIVTSTTDLDISDHSDYCLEGTPEARLLQGGPFACIQAANTEYHCGILLRAPSGEPVGILSSFFRRQPDDLPAVESALSRYALRAAAEMARVQTEEALRESESRYRDLIQYSSEAVWCLEPVPALSVDIPEDEFVAKFWESRVAVANDAAARTLGYQTAEQILGLRLCEFRAMLPHLETQIRQQIRDGFPARTLEFSILRDGVESWWERSAIPVVTAGKLVRVWGTTRDISERRRHEGQIQALNASLKSAIADRTAQLAAANQELESFSYSVSHDLRAAIQGILACSRIVVQDHGDKLDETGKAWLAHMAEDAAQLDKLTMALLDLSLVSRASLCRCEVDLSELAESTCQRLAAAEPARQLDFRVAPGITVSADPTLLRAVMDNLLGNAWKFTKTRPVAEIEFGTTNQAGESVFFVRDNGVGFNMKYAGKLFGAFQRLHRVGDFEGNGIGLATVRRVIHRHGGRVWADAKNDGGATFYFTLGKSDSE